MLFDIAKAGLLEISAQGAWRAAGKEERTHFRDDARVDDRKDLGPAAVAALAPDRRYDAAATEGTVKATLNGRNNPPGDGSGAGAS